MRTRTRIITLGVTAALSLFAGRSQADIKINEIYINPPGTDNGQEFVELKSTTGGVEAMTGLTLIAIDGDGASAGVIDVALSLNPHSTGPNGLFLWRDSATVLSPTPHAQTVINIADFNPDLENGSNTFLLVMGFSGAIGNDLDTDNNGIIDVALPWITVVDAVGVTENDGASNFPFGSQFGGVDFPSTTFTGDAIVRLDGNGVIVMDVLGAAPGPYSFSPTEMINNTGAAVAVADLTFATLSPGSANPALVPEPATLSLMAMLACLGLRRWKSTK